MLDEPSLIQQLTGPILRRIVAGFYKRVKTDPLIGPMYPADDWEGSQKRLGDFLTHRFLADPTYMQERGNPRLKMRHFPFSIGVTERDQWMRLMGAAVEEENELSAEAKEALIAFFAPVADHMRNRMEK